VYLCWNKSQAFLIILD